MPLHLVYVCWRLVFYHNNVFFELILLLLCSFNNILLILIFKQRLKLRVKFFSPVHCLSWIHLGNNREWINILINSITYLSLMVAICIYLVDLSRLAVSCGKLLFQLPEVSLVVLLVVVWRLWFLFWGFKRSFINVDFVKFWALACNRYLFLRYFCYFFLVWIFLLLSFLINLFRPGWLIRIEFDFKFLKHTFLDMDVSKDRFH